MSNIASRLANYWQKFEANMKSFGLKEAGLRSYWLFASLLVVVVAVMYAGTVHNPLLFDDLNQLVSERIFSDYGGNFSIFQVRWVSYGTFALTYKLVGENWLVFRVTNILLHIGTVLAIFWFYSSLYRVVNGDTSQNSRTLYPLGVAFAGALIFGVHPTSVYAAGYLLQRSIVMATLFSILSLACLLNGLEKGKKWWYVASGFFYVLAVFSKEHSFLILAVALVLVGLVRKPTLRGMKEFWWVVPIGLVVVSGLFYYYADILGKAFDETSQNFLGILAKQNPDIQKYAYPLSIMNQGYLFFKYLLLWFVPYPGWMSVDIRETFPVSFFSWPESIGFVAFLVWPVIGGRLLLRGGEKGLFGFGMLFPWVLFLSELTVVWVQDPFVIYRNYLWLAGLPAMLPLILSRFPERAAYAVLAIMVVIAGGIATNRLATFKSELAAWNDALSYNEDQRSRLGKDRLYAGRGGAYIKSGNAELALADFKKAIEINPAKSDSWVNRGTAYFMLREYSLALNDYSKAIELNKDNFKAYYNRAAANNQIGHDELAMQDLDYLVQAAGSLTWADVYILRSAVYRKQGRNEGALQELDKALGKDGRNLNALIDRGTLYLQMNRFIDALQDFDAARAINPNPFDVQFGRGIANFRLGRNQEALDSLSNAISTDPTHVKAHLFRSQVYVRLNQIQRALDEYALVLKLNPSEAQAYLNRGEIFFALKNFDGAQKDLGKACELGMQVGCEKLKQIVIK
ncbi:MAG: tetratricopeptide repeat protein [Sulfuricella sp.]|nr:tetratricopeptide repeat protein [Sulfuricella sp.]